MEEKIGDNESIHLRAVRFGYDKKHRNGFLYSEIKEWYATKRPEEWKLVDEYLSEAYRNKEEGRNQTTPFILLEKLKNENENKDKCKYALSYEAYFNYLDYLELVEARKTSEEAKKQSTLAIWIAIITLLCSIIFSVWSIVSPITIEKHQYRNLIKSMQCTGLFHI
jgi:hypothetical protein